MRLGSTLLPQVNPPWRAAWLLTILVVGLSFLGGIVATREPLLALGGALALSLAAALLVWSNTAVLLVVFLLYSNFVVVAVKFHGLPFIIGAAFPLLLLIPLGERLIFRREKLVFHAAFPYIVLFLVVELVGTLLARDIGQATSNLVETVLEGLVIYLLITNVVRTPRELRGVVWVLLLAGVCMSLVPIYQQASGSFSNDFGGLGQTSEVGFRTGEETLQGEVRQFRLTGPIGEQNRYAQIMLVIVPLGLFQAWGEKSRWLRVTALMAAGFSAAGVALTFSRGAAVAFAIMVLIMVLMRIVKVSQLAPLVVGAALLLAIFPQYSTRLLSIEELTTLASEGATEEVDGALTGRATAMLAALYIFLDHPLVGVGPGMTQFYTREYGNQLALRFFTEDRQAHSLFLDIAASHGLLGLIAFGGMLLVTLRDLYRIRLRWLNTRPDLANMATGFFFAIIAYLAAGLFLHLSYVRYFWLILGLGGAASYVVQALEAGRTEAALDDKARMIE